MAYVSGFDHDIFVSYALVDDAIRPGIARGWVTSFIRTLEVSLSVAIGRLGRLEPWWDQSHLAENQPLDKQIEQALERTACLVVILSPGFLESPWCPKELDTFQKAISKQGRSDSRIFVVDLGSVTDQQKRAIFSNYKPFDLWIMDDKKRRRPMGFPEPNGKDHPDFYDAVQYLAERIKEEFDHLKQAGVSYVKQNQATLSQASNLVAATPEPALTGPVVYVAETSDDLSGARKQLVAFLESHQFRVALGGRNAVEFESWKEAALKELAGATCFVQMLGMYPGRELKGAHNGIVRLQHDLAVESGKKVIQWRAPDLLSREFEDANHFDFVKNATAIECPLEAFKWDVKRVAALPPPEKNVEKVAEIRSSRPGDEDTLEETLTVFIHGGIEDNEQTEWLAKELTNLNCSVSSTLTSGEPASIREDTEANLMKCDVLIVLYGKVPPEWVRAQFRTFPRIFPKRDRLGRTKQLKALAICNGEPSDKPPLGIKVPGLKSINLAKANSRSLAKWVDELRNGGDL